MFEDVLWVKEARQEHLAFVDDVLEHGRIVHEGPCTDLLDDPRVFGGLSWLETASG